MLLRTRFLRILADGPRAKRILLGVAKSHGKEGEFDAEFQALVDAGAIRQLRSKRHTLWGLPKAKARGARP